jgi:uncharacterized protein YehS (DUF1456 family)
LAGYLDPDSFHTGTCYFTVHQTPPAYGVAKLIALSSPSFRQHLHIGIFVENNDILRRIRYIFKLSDSKMMSIFAAADLEVSRELVSDLLKNEKDPAFQSCTDLQLTTFLNGFICDRRGKKEGSQPIVEKRLNNNIIFRKLKIALNLKDHDILEVLNLADLRFSKHELSAFFRKTEHKHYRKCKDQVLRNFLQGLQDFHRPSVQQNESFKWK